MLKLLAWLAALWFSAPTLAIFVVMLRLIFSPAPEHAEPAPTEKRMTLDELLAE